MAVSVPMTRKEIRADAGPLRTTSLDSCDIKDPEAQTLPNYLRASIGSCHDFCKFGRRRDLTVETTSTMSGTPPLSPNTGREPNKSNYLKKRNSSSSTFGSPSTISRSPVCNVRANEIQLEAKKLEGTAKSPRKLTMKPFEKKGFPNRIWNYGGNASKQTQSPRGSKKSTSLPKAGSFFQKPEVRKERKRAASPKTKDTKTDTEPASVEDTPEKILFVTELNSENKAAGFTLEENICGDSLECQRHTDDCLLQNTEDECFVDKEIDPVHFSSSPKERNDSQSHEWDNSTASSSSAAEADRKPDEDENEMINLVLRHQHVEPRSAESLLNEMIEETARKLAKTKSSKVKALVDAFESVISFQDLSLQEQLKCGESPKFPLCGE